jgi:hypothetical protein
MNWLLNRLREPSTWFGLFAVGSAFFGIELTPDQKEAVMMLAIALLGGGLVVSKG